jgi:acyl-CoA synthetase (AMP-forming)/AMP-acid ligase II
MLYSSGTTGRPKGVKRRIALKPFGSDAMSPIYDYHKLNADSVFLSPAPLYHAAPLRSVMAVQRLGGTVIVMDKFEPRSLLEAAASYRATHIQLVPTMLRRLLDLPMSVRESYDLSSLRCVIHAAAPCPIALKQAAIDWLGPIVNEYYGGTEGVGVTYITSEEWLKHRGSVGRAIIGEPHIVGDDGNELPPGETGLIYFGNGPAFEYHNAPEKMAEVTDDRGWITLGDIGRLDGDGFLYLTDRRSFVINSGGVNIYPQEIEDTLLKHPDVVDAAVFGVPNDDFGEEVKAVVQMKAPVHNAETTAASLVAFCRARISHLKCPRSIDFIDVMPRSETGKLLKTELKQAYWRQGART